MPLDAAEASLLDASSIDQPVKRAKGPFIGVLFVLAAVKLLIPPALIYQNDLMVPVRVVHEEYPNQAFILRPGEQKTIRILGIPRARWVALGVDGVTPLHLGMLRAGEFAEPTVPLLLQRLLYLRYERHINRQDGDREYFVLLVTNNERRPLRFFVILKEGMIVRCSCVIPAVSERYFAGYYREDAESIVLNDDANGELQPIDIASYNWSPTGVLQILVGEKGAGLSTARTTR